LRCRTGDTDDFMQNTDMGGRRASLPPAERAAAEARREASAALQPIGRQPDRAIFVLPPSRWPLSGITLMPLGT
jgi:hypothetical protein